MTSGLIDRKGTRMTIPSLDSATVAAIPEGPGVVSETFEGGIYKLGLMAHGGSHGAFYWNDWEPDPIEEPSEGSPEALLGTLSHDYSLLDSADVPGAHWSSEPQVARPPGYEEMRADWTKGTDGLLFIRTMDPNTKVKQWGFAPSLHLSKSGCGFASHKRSTSPWLISNEVPRLFAGGLYVMVRVTFVGTCSMPAC